MRARVDENREPAESDHGRFAPEDDRNAAQIKQRPQSWKL
jgi:hypothetical protein